MNKTEELVSAYGRAEYQHRRQHTSHSGSDVDKARAALLDHILSIELERDQLQGAYTRACKLVVDMHCATTGRPGEGPILGVIEDCAAVRAELDSMRQDFAYAVKA